MDAKKAELRRFAETMLDVDRLKILGELARGTREVADLVARTGLPEDRVTAHLRKLSQTGVVAISRDEAGESVYFFDEKALEKMSRRQFAAMRARKRQPDTRQIGPQFSEREAGIIRKLTYLDGKIRHIPGPNKVEKTKTLARYAAQFVEPGRIYSERQVNELFKPLTSDTATLRRYTIDHGFMGRSKDGSEYWLEEAGDA